MSLLLEDTYIDHQTKAYPWVLLILIISLINHYKNIYYILVEITLKYF